MILVPELSPSPISLWMCQRTEILPLAQAFLEPADPCHSIGAGGRLKWISSKTKEEALCLLLVYSGVPFTQETARSAASSASSRSGPRRSASHSWLVRSFMTPISLPPRWIILQKLVGCKLTQSQSQAIMPLNSDRRSNRCTATDHSLQAFVVHRVLGRLLRFI